ncbi:MAG: radical SAM protein [Deltaproteobacteria bacterium]|jgi:hypothetical protein|nr:radical SAM protein [Deltaproteobacteria bacterium]MBW2533784.1 radical SAM protein [Deltaproteobacteria bacterium]
MKVAFVSGNREQLPDAVIPLGLLYVMQSCPDEHDKVLWDLCFETAPLAVLAERLRGFDPDVVALGMRNVQNNDYGGVGDNVAYYRSLIETIRAHSDARVVLGGGGFSIMPAELMAELRPDFGVAGEGERAFPRLLEALEGDGQSLSGVPGVYRWDADRPVEGPPAQSFLEVDGLPAPDRRLVDPRYYERFGIESVQTKRGCSLSCEYCTYPTIEGRTVRQRSPERVVDEMFEVVRHHPDVKHLFVVDSVFNLPPSHAKAVCREMIARRFPLPWTCYANPIGFDDELAQLMAEAGCTGLEIGSDSGCDEILKALKKGFDVPSIRRMHDVVKRVKIKDCHTFMLGTPSETMAHVDRTLKFIVELDPFCAIIMTWVDDHEAVDPDRAAERAELRWQIDALLHRIAPEHPRWIMPGLKINFDQKLFAVLRRMGLAGPLWQHIDLAQTRRGRFAGMRP